MQQKVLILTAIPHGLCLDKEIRSIEEAIRRSARRDRFKIRMRTVVRPQDIRRAIAPGCLIGVVDIQGVNRRFRT